ncbi:hypothetical protein HPB51_022698 [Rhipicephalus microplus]|uniref:Kelch-like protein diablo n=1 Tax=Rhipicephalus microplus TaxID=6941 RepID=A0A9J6E4B9_RHIMP|nr:hypothetical protein HPB51_022698 [Rhipicephalus microplus]
MCAPVAAEMKDSTVNGADNKDDMLTASFQATQLFTDDGRQREFTPAAAARAMPGLREQRKTRQFCDVLFRATNGPEVWAHRFVMCAKYSSCYTLFAIAKETMAPEQRKEVGCPPVRALIEDLEGDMIELLVDFAYLIPMHERIGTHNIVRVLELAEKLKLIQVRDHCMKTLKQNLEPENCIQTYHLASSSGYEYLAGEAHRYLVRSFDAVGVYFHSLYRVAYERDRNETRFSETTVKKKKHAGMKKTTRKHYLAKFLPLVRFVRCSVTEFEKVLSYPEVQRDQSSLKVLTVIHKTLTRPSMEVGNVAGIDLSQKQWLRPRIPKDILFVFGGWTSGATNSMHTFNSRAQKWRVMGSQYTPPRAYHGAAVIDSRIYIVGGFNGRECYHSVVCFDVPLARWSAKANMEYARCYVSVAVLQASAEHKPQGGNIYAMGGFDGRSRTKTVERYDIKANQWSLVADMVEVRSDASAASAHGRIYIAGGFTGAAVLDSVESYDPSTNAWTRIVTMSSPRSGAKVVAHEDMLYIIGGYNGVTRLSSMEQLDVKRARTTELPSMLQAKSNFAAIVLDGCIYTIGGFDGITTIQLVEKYDIAARGWYTAPQISTNCSASTACVVEDIADPSKCFVNAEAYNHLLCINLLGSFVDIAVRQPLTTLVAQKGVLNFTHSPARA